MCTVFRMNGALAVESEKPMTFELAGSTLKYYLCAPSLIHIGSPSKPSKVTVNGRTLDSFTFDDTKKAVTITLPAGEGIVTLQ